MKSCLNGAQIYATASKPNKYHRLRMHIWYVNGREGGRGLRKQRKKGQDKNGKGKGDGMGRRERKKACN